MKQPTHQPSAARRVFEAVLRWGAHVAAVAVILIMLVTLADIGQRLATGRSIVGALEWTEVLLVGAVWLGIGDAERQGAHVRTDVITRRMSPRVRAIARTVGMVFMIAFLAVLVAYSATRAYASTLEGEFKFGLARIPLWPARLVLLFGAVLVLCQSLLELTDLLRGRGFLVAAADSADDDETTASHVAQEGAL